MYEVVFGVALWITVVIGIVFNFITWREVTRSIELNAKNLPELNIDKVVQAVGDEIDEIISDSMSNFSMPTAQDHLFGMISQFVQMKMVKDLNKDGLLQPNIDESESQ